ATQVQQQQAQDQAQRSQLNENQAAGMAALNQAMSGSATATTPSPVVITTTAGAPTSASAPVVPPAQAASPQPISPLPFYSGPKSPVSSAKQQQLQALLQKYMANQITPGEYQTQRAAILAQPN